MHWTGSRRRCTGQANTKATFENIGIRGRRAGRGRWVGQEVQASCRALSTLRSTILTQQVAVGRLVAGGTPAEGGTTAVEGMLGLAGCTQGVETPLPPESERLSKLFSHRMG